MKKLSHKRPEWWISGQHMPPSGTYCGGPGHCAKCGQKESDAITRQYGERSVTEEEQRASMERLDKINVMAYAIGACRIDQLTFNDYAKATQQMYVGPESARLLAHAAMDGLERNGRMLAGLKGK